MRREVDRFEALVQDCQQELFAFLLARCRSRDAALDCLQETLLQGWRHRERLLALDPIATRRLLFAIARNKAIDHHRWSASGMRAAERELPAELPQRPAATEDPRLALLERCLASLDEDARELLYLRELGGLSSNQIGERLGRPAATIRSQLARLRQDIQAQFLRLSHEEAP